MIIFIAVQENKKGSLLLCADVDRDTVEKIAEQNRKISDNPIRTAKIELTNKRIQYGQTGHVRTVHKNPRHSEIMKRIDMVGKMKEIQGNDGNWNYNDYMCGLYNGLELAQAIMENRDPNYRKLKGKELER